MRVLLERGKCKRCQLLCNLLCYPLGAAINSQSIEGGTPLYVAAEYGRVTVVELVSSSFISLRSLHLLTCHDIFKLLSKGADVNLKFRTGATPLVIAAEKGFTWIVGVCVLTYDCYY